MVTPVGIRLKEFPLTREESFDQKEEELYSQISKGFGEFKRFWV
jgi:hypothetical protein